MTLWSTAAAKHAVNDATVSLFYDFLTDGRQSLINETIKLVNSEFAHGFIF